METRGVIAARLLLKKISEQTANRGGGRGGEGISFSAHNKNEGAGRRQMFFHSLTAEFKQLGDSLPLLLVVNANHHDASGCEELRVPVKRQLDVSFRHVINGFAEEDDIVFLWRNETLDIAAGIGVFLFPLQLPAAIFRLLQSDVGN